MGRGNGSCGGGNREPTVLSIHGSRRATQREVLLSVLVATRNRPSVPQEPTRNLRKPFVFCTGAERRFRGNGRENKAELLFLLVEPSRNRPSCPLEPTRNLRKITAVRVGVDSRFHRNRCETEGNLLFLHWSRVSVPREPTRSQG